MVVVGLELGDVLGRTKHRPRRWQSKRKWGAHSAHEKHESGMHVSGDECLSASGRWAREHIPGRLDANSWGWGGDVHACLSSDALVKILNNGPPDTGQNIVGA